MTVSAQSHHVFIDECAELSQEMFDRVFALVPQADDRSRFTGFVCEGYGKRECDTKLSRYRAHDTALCSSCDRAKTRALQDALSELERANELKWMYPALREEGEKSHVELAAEVVVTVGATRKGIFYGTLTRAPEEALLSFGEKTYRRAAKALLQSGYLTELIPNEAYALTALYDGHEPRRFEAM